MQRATDGCNAARNYGGVRVNAILLTYLLLALMFVIITLVLEDDGQGPLP